MNSDSDSSGTATLVQPHTEERPSLSQVLFNLPRRNFGSLAPVPSNVYAIEAAHLFCKGLHTFVALVGPTGWGKSHLLEAVSTRIAADDRPSPVVYSAVEWALGMSKSDTAAPLLLDNVQVALDQSRTRQALRMALERRVKSGRPTMLSFTAGKVGRQIRTLLPNSRDWIFSQMGTPEPSERIVVLEQIAGAEGLTLSPSLAKLIAYRMRGNGRTLLGALKRLKLYGSNWSDSLSTLRACGILDMFFIDNSDWDLRECILRVSERPEFSLSRGRSHDLAIYVMLREACLSEAQVAQFFSIEPSEAYLRANSFERSLAESTTLKSAVKRLTDTTVADLLQD